MSVVGPFPSELVIQKSMNFQASRVVDYSSLSAREKAQYSRFLIENDVRFQYSPSRNKYVAKVCLVEPSTIAHSSAQAFNFQHLTYSRLRSPSQAERQEIAEKQVQTSDRLM